MRTTLLLAPLLAAACSLSLTAQAAGQEAKAAPKNDHLGYVDTPHLPNSTWRVHDRARTRPRRVDPGPATAPVTAPSDATVLFAGSFEHWQRAGKKGGAPAWKLVDAEHGSKAMEVAKGGGDIVTKQQFGGTFQLHVEWASPIEPKGKGQGRGNSGVFLMGRYEVQVLDSYDNDTYADGQAAALYGQKPPLVNACRGPGEWQTYDIVFTAPTFDGDAVASPATVTVFHNGVLVHEKQPLLGATAHRNVAKYHPHGPTGPIKLQDHGNPVRFRNIWIRQIEAPKAENE